MKRTTVIVCLLTMLAGFTSPQENAPVVLTGSYLGQQPPGDTPVLFAPGVISKGKEHSAAMFTADGNEIWFGRMFPAKIYHMKRVDEIWTEPRVASFCDTFNYLYPVLAHDGSRIFFSSDRPKEQSGSRLPRGRVDIWMVKRTIDGWSEPLRLNDNVNYSRRNSCGSTTSNGNLYFTASTKNSSIDVFCSSLVDGNYAAPGHLTEIDSPTPDHCPFVAPDESYMILSSFRGGLGLSDLFISFRNEDGSWTEPSNMGPTINSAYKDEYPFVTPDGKYLFFNSNRPSSLNPKPIQDGPGNIYWVSTTIIEQFRQAHNKP